MSATNKLQELEKIVGAASRNRSQAASTVAGSQTNPIAIENTTVESAPVKLKATPAPEAKRENGTATENQALLPLTRADRLAVELLQASCREIMATKEMTARLQDEVALRTGGQAAGLPARPTPMKKPHPDWDI
jgi:hypothetical protein